MNWLWWRRTSPIAPGGPYRIQGEVEPDPAPPSPWPKRLKRLTFKLCSGGMVAAFLYGHTGSLVTSLIGFWSGSTVYQIFRRMVNTEVPRLRASPRVRANTEESLK